MPKTDESKRGVTHNTEGEAVQGDAAVGQEVTTPEPLTDKEREELAKQAAEPRQRIAEEENPKPKTGKDAPVLGGSSEPIAGGEAHIQAARA